jgi:Mn-dependent DtxR family transcriptional regulator
MRVTCGLTAAEETALRQLAERHRAAHQLNEQVLAKQREEARARHEHAAADDVARHGLRRCALPSCAAQEAHPKLFKLCGSCNAAAYCCKEHQTEDWKRHKREDGCAAAP